jgi:putative MATE family efflux protein
MATTALLVRDEILAAPIVPTMLKLAVPTVVVLVAQTAVGVAETYYVGFLGTDALAGVSLVFPVLMLMTMMSNGGLGSGVASAVARAVGAGRRNDADALALHAVGLAVVFGIAFTALTFALGPALYGALGGHGAALHAAVLYSTFVFAGAVPVWVVNLMASALRGAGNVRVPALVTLVGALVLIPASPALIFGFGPIPRLGIAGAGIAVSTYYTIAAIVLMRYLASGRGGVRLQRGPLEARLFRDILRVGLIASVGAVQPNLTVLLVTGAVGRFGIDALAGYGIASRLDYVLIPLLFGLGTAVLTMVGTNVGGGNLARAKRITWIGAGVGAAFAGVIGLVIALLPQLWLDRFSHDPAVVSAGALYLRIVAPVYAATGLAFIVTFAAQGGGRMLWPFLGGTARLVLAAGVGWLAVAWLGAGLPALFAIVAFALVAYAAICAAAARSGAIWRPGAE